MMEPSFGNDSAAVVGRAEDRSGAARCPVGGWPSGCTVWTSVAPSRSSKQTFRPSPGHRWTITKSARRSSKYLMADFASPVPAMSSNLGGTVRAGLRNRFIDEHTDDAVAGFLEVGWLTGPIQAASVKAETRTARACGYRCVPEGQGRLGRRHRGRAGLIRIGRPNLHSERHWQ